MENRERDKMSPNQSSTDSEKKDKSESSVVFGQNIGRSEEWNSEPSKRSGSMSGDSKSRSNLGEQSDVRSIRDSWKNEH